jgi:signal transduction histidine kinase
MPDAVNVALIGADNADTSLIKTSLRSSDTRYRILHRGSLEQAARLLKQDASIDVIICDVTLPDATATKTFQRFKRIAANLPVIFLASQKDEHLAQHALQKGAEDYLVKGKFDSETLTRAIRYAMERKSYQRQAEQARTNSRALRLRAQILKEKSAQLQALSEAKDDFIALASHQLRTPATGIRQYIGMLREGYFGELNDAQKQMLDVAHESSERQLRIVDDLLKVARVDSGYFELKKTRTDLVQVVRDVIHEHTQQIELKQQQLEFKTDLPALMANIDAAQIRIVLENLLDNAHKYTPAGKRINVSIGYKTGKAVIDVKDEGVGISKSDLTKLFEKFRRIINPHNETFGGSGLGLYWAKRIIDLHGGSLEAFSTVGKGTIFSVSLEA